MLSIDMKILAEDSASRELLAIEEDNDEHSTGEANMVDDSMEAAQQT
jgi:hypothetical protein